MFTKTSLVLALGAIAVSADQTLDFSPLSNQCPSGWSSNTLGDGNQVYCCAGSGIQIDDTGACCIGIGTMGPRGSCSTTVAYSGPNYSSIVSSLAAETGSSSPATNSVASMSSMDMASMTGMSGMTTSVSGDSDMTMTTSGADAAMTSGSSTSSGAGVAITGAPVLANVLLGAAGAALLL